MGLGSNKPWIHGKKKTQPTTLVSFAFNKQLVYLRTGRIPCSLCREFLNCTVNIRLIFCYLSQLVSVGAWQLMGKQIPKTGWVWICNRVKAAIGVYYGWTKGMIALGNDTLPGGIMSLEWNHRLKQSAVNLSRPLFCVGCSLVPSKNLEQALWATVHSQDTSSGQVLSPHEWMGCVLGYRSIWCPVIREQS